MSEEIPKEHHFSMTPNAWLRCPIFTGDWPKEIQPYWNELWEQRLRVFGRVFPWVRGSILALAGLPPDTVTGPGGTLEHNRAYSSAHNQYLLGTNSGDDKVRAIHEQQNREWKELTKVEPLGTPGEWWTAATLAGASPPAEFGIDDFSRYAGVIVAWASQLRDEIAARKPVPPPPPEIRWSRPVTKKQLYTSLGVTLKTLNSRLTNGPQRIPGLYRFRSQKPTSRIIEVALDDLPAELQAKMTTSKGS